MKRDKILWLKKCKKALVWVWNSFPFPHEFGYCGKNVILLYPMRIYSPSTVFVYENVKLTHGLKIINTSAERVVIKKYSVLAADCTIITNNHRSTVTIPQFVLGASHVNDKSADVVIEEDVWLGVGVTVLAGVHIGRGCIVGAGSIVTHNVPPYSVVTGSPARIVKKNFSNTQIVEHEKALYPVNERMTMDELEELDRTYFYCMNTYGIDKPLDKCAIKKIEETKRALCFVEP